eukprot:700445-Alexandrium_andersonii.AAC.1
MTCAGTHVPELAQSARTALAPMLISCTQHMQARKCLTHCAGTRVRELGPARSAAGAKSALVAARPEGAQVRAVRAHTAA